MKEPKRFVGIVIPGDKLGVIEEFHPGRGTYVAEGIIHAQTTGIVQINRESKRISVFQRSKMPVTPRKGMTVVGEVQQVQDKFANVKIRRLGRSELTKPFAAVLYVAFAQKGFVKSIRDIFKPGDIIYGEVMSDENYPYLLTTAGKEYGVLQAFCSNCGDPLTLDGRRLLCRRCRRIERRMISDKYGKDL